MGDDLVTPSQATMQRPHAVLLSTQTVDLTLTDAVFLGLRGNRTIRSAYVSRVAQKFDLRVAEDLFTPKLLLTGQLTKARSQDGNGTDFSGSPTVTMQTEVGTQFSLSWTRQISNTDRTGQFRNDGVNFQVVQPLLRGAGRDVATAPVRLAKLTEQNNRLNLQAAVSQTITQIVLAYRELLRAQEQLHIANDALVRSQQLFNINKALIAAGRMAQFDIVQTEADAATQELNVEDAKNQLDASRLALLQLLGLDLTSRIQASDSLKAEPMEINLMEAQNVALGHQPEYLRQRIAAEQADINLVVARNNRLWDVSLVGGASQVRDRFSSDFGSFSDRRWEGYVGVQVQIPIGDLTSRQTEVHAKGDVDNEAILVKEAEQQLERDISDAVRDVGSRWRQYELSVRARDLSVRKLDIEREKLQAGRSSNFQVLSFEADLRNAESARLNALISYLDAQTQLDQRLGMALESWDIALND
ncbi:TolC family protein [Caballeronia sordidicola]|nr:TolC family protein [Caballeronia sordidicola]